MVLTIWIILCLGVALASNRPKIFELENNAGIYYEEEAKIKILNQPIEIFTLFNLKIQNDLTHTHVKKSGNASKLIYAGNKYRSLMKDVPIIENKVFADMLNETEIKFTDNPRAIYFLNQQEAQLRNIWAETYTTSNITERDTETLAEIIEKISEVIETTRKFEQPLEFFKTIDFIGIRNRLNKFFKEEVIPVEKCKFRIETEIARLNNETLAFIFKVPTVLNEEYTAYRLHRMPNFLDIGLLTLSLRILFKNDFLAINKEGGRSFFLSETDILNSKYCSNENIYLKRAPIINIKMSCEEELLRFNNMKCPTETSVAVGPIIERTRSGVVYSVTGEEKVNIKCANYNQPKILKGHGLVKLPSSCEILIRDKIYKGTVNSMPRFVTPQGNLEFGDISKYLTTPEPITESVVTKDESSDIELENNKILTGLALVVLSVSILVGLSYCLFKKKSYRRINDQNLVNESYVSAVEFKP